MNIFTQSFKILSLFSVLSVLSVTVMAQKADSTSTTKAPDSVAIARQNATALKASGTIIDAATGKPISGVNVSVVDFSGAITNEKGNFTIKVPSYSAVLNISAPSYQSKEVPLKGRKSISTSLYDEGFTSVYDQANMPFGPKPINNLTKAVSIVDTKGSWETFAETPDSYLQGQVAGLNAVRRSGTPNIGADLFLRGYNSLYATNKPLIIVDGVIYDNAHYGSSLVGGHYNNPLANIDQNDIESYTIIKDGASMYGTKAANGVILITTGHSKDLATKIDFGIYTGFNFKPKNMPVLGANDFRVYLSDMLKSSGQTDAQIQAQPYMNDNVNSGTYYNYHNNTDWQKEVFKNSLSQNYYLRVSGGDDIARYTLSLGYANDGGITDNTSSQKYNTRFNADLNLSKKFTVGANVSFTYNEQSLFDQGVSPKSNPIFLSQVKAPFERQRQVNGAGLESPNYENLDIFNVGNPLSIIDTAQNTAKSYRFLGAINFKFKFNKYSSLQSVFAVTYDKVRESTFLPRAGVLPDTLGSVAVNGKNAILYSRLGSQVQRLFSLYNDTHYSYDRVFNRIHHITANVGLRYLDNESTVNVARGYNSATDQFISVGTGVNALRTTGGELGNSNWLSTYLGVDYQLLNKYFFSYNMAVDGSSKFGTQIPNTLSINGVKLAVLPSLSVGWLISSEKFMSNINFVELLKLRASYSLTGNDDVGNYTARQYYVSQNLLGQEGLVRGNIGNSNLQWESNKKANIGIDASLLNERLAITFDVYQNNTSNMLINEPQAAASGFTFAVTNSGGMRTQGIELGVNYRIVNHTQFKWDAGFNIAKYRNKITQLPNNSMTTNFAGATILTQVGLPANLYYGYKTNGVYTSTAQAVASGTKEVISGGLTATPQGGDVRFVDINGDNIIDAQDRQVIGNPNPDFTGALNSTLTYKRVSFSALFTFSKGGQLFNYVRQQLESQKNFYNQTPYVLNRWRVDGQVTNVPRVSYGDPIGNSRFSDRWIEDGSYIRLRTLSASYSLPINGKGGIKAIKLYATANNLITFTKYLGYDPEFSATESVFTQGIDTGLEPQFKSVQIGVRLGL
jgi:TonB-linked SusC/RagA family outer membrane protein